MTRSNQKFTTTAALAVVLAFGVMGCELSTPDQPAANPFPVTLQPMQFEGGSATVHEVPEAVATVLSAIRSADTWERADANLSLALKRLGPGERTLAEQFAAAAMLNSPLTEGSPDARRQEVALHYLRLLAQHRSPEAMLYERGLAFVDGYVSAPEAARLAAVAVEAASMHYARAEPCADCGLPTGEVPPHVQTMVEAAVAQLPASSHAGETRAAADRLGALVR